MGFDVPVVLFIYKRVDTLVKVIDVLRSVAPQKVYILSDGPRSDSDRDRIDLCRSQALSAIDWDCEIITRFHDENVGCYESIGNGARWVFEREDTAIFLEDDNLPEVTFFEFCRTMLKRYCEDPRILWVCGTNYLEHYRPKNDASYVFTRHMLPCGWASWGNRYRAAYDGELIQFDDANCLTMVKRSYRSRALYRQMERLWRLTQYHLRHNRRAASWDYQMAFSIRSKGLLGIVPSKNQIKNIGVDEFSEHGGTSLQEVMTRRFCGMASLPLDSPYTHPESVDVDPEFEGQIDQIILLPLSYRLRMAMSRLAKCVLGLEGYLPISESISLRAKEKGWVLQVLRLIRLR